MEKGRWWRLVSFRRRLGVVITDVREKLGYAIVLGGQQRPWNVEREMRF